MHFSKYARKVIMLVRGESLSTSMSQYLIDQIAATENIQVCTGCSVMEVKGDEHLEEIVIAHAQDWRNRNRTSAIALYLHWC